MTTFALILCIITSFTGYNQISATLRLTNVLYRHGDRTPIIVFPTDGVKESDWKEGLGELTMLGIQQEYKLGAYIKNRYKEYMSSSYNPKEIYVQSTDVNRCLMSAQAVLSAMYPPAGDQQWNATIAWQPIPVHTVPIDYEQTFSKAPCEKLWELGNNTKESDTVVKYVNETYGEWIRFVNKKAGYTDWEMSANDLFGNSTHVYGNFFIEQLKDRLHLNPWVNDTLMEVFREKIVPLSLFLRKQHFEIQRLLGGAMIHKIATDMKMRKEGLLDEQMKMFMYSGHDTTLMPILNLLVPETNFTNPPYSALLMLELHQKEKTGEKNSSSGGQYYVQLWYRPGGEKEAVQYKIKGCPEMDCDWETFWNVTAPVRVQDRATECQLHKWFGVTSYRGVFIVACVSSTMVLLLTLILCVMCCKKKCARRKLPRKYHVHQKVLPEQVPMINTALSDED